MPPIVLIYIAYLVGGYEAAGLIAFITVGIRVIDSMYPDQPQSTTPPPSEWKSVRNYGIYIPSGIPAACVGVRITELYSLPTHPCLNTPSSMDWPSLPDFSRERAIAAETYAYRPIYAGCLPRCNATTRADYCP